MRTTNGMLNALQQWRFRPRLIYKPVVPVSFTTITRILDADVVKLASFQRR